MRTFAPWLVAVVLLPLGCSDSLPPLPDQGSGRQDAGSIDGTGADGPWKDPDGSVIVDGRPLPDGPSAGCLGNEACTSTGRSDYCHFASGCGADGPGECRARPEACPDVYQPVCGCDGKDYDNVCTANAAGTSVKKTGSCDGLCSNDSDCTPGAQWCVGGKCVPCDNGGLGCTLACPNGWGFYQRNGCQPCECAPPNACETSSDCPLATSSQCYAGQFCTDWCPPGDPSCCRGNLCSAPGCTLPVPVTCGVTGCPLGQNCDFTTSSFPSHCDCFVNTSGTANWGCTKDSAPGVCVGK